MQVPARNAQLHAAEAEKPANPGLVEEVAQRDLAQLDEAGILVELGLGTVEDATAAGEPRLTDRHGRSRARPRHGLASEVGVAKHEVSAIPHDLRLLGRTEVGQCAFSLIAGDAPLPDVE